MNFIDDFLGSDRSLPAKGELEFSLFGVGVGECIVLHLGNGQWIVVDSFINPDTKNAVALDYLTALGVDIKSQVVQIVTTHWHDDHIRGISNVFRAAESAVAVCSNCLQHKQFFELVALHASNKQTLKALSTGTDEFRDLLAIAYSRKERGTQHPIVWAICNRTIFEVGASKLTALSPSDAEITRSHAEIGRLLPTAPGQTKLRLPSIEPNDTAIALWGTMSGVHFLLGSDLENAPAADRGWKAVLALTPRPQGKASLFKVPHHGAESGHHDQVWSDLVEARVLAALTPFTKSKLPTSIDVERIRGYTNAAYIAADRAPKKVAKKEPAVDKTFNEVVTSSRVLETKLGLVRVRYASAASAPTVQLFGSALPL